MLEERDFEQTWLAKFSSSLDEIAGEEIRQAVIEGSDELSSHSTRQEVIDWSKGALERVDSLVDKEKRKRIMTGCACSTQSLTCRSCGEPMRTPRMLV